MATDAPTSESEFERLLLGSANSSYLWIQYMSFFLQQSDLVRARQIAQRALQTINYREQEEKRNVWLAILNLENTAGTEESLEQAFKDAIQSNEPKHMHLSYIEILEGSGKYTVSGNGLSANAFAHLLLCRSAKQSLSALWRSSARAPRFGQPMASFCLIGTEPTKLVPCYHAVWIHCRSGNVWISLPSLKDYLICSH